MEIETSRLIIRKVEMSDVLFILEAMECPEIHQMHNNGFSSIEKVQSYIEVLLKEYSFEKYKTLAIAEKNSNKLIGLITVDIIEVFSRGEFSYWINKKYRNIGYATEVIKAMTTYCFNSGNLNRIEAITTNPASEKVLEKSGMIYEGTLRQYLKINGVYWDMKMYSILYGDFNAVK